MSVLAIDVGATKVAVGIVSVAGDVLARSYCESVGAATADELMNRIRLAIAEVCVDHSPTVVGVGAAGPRHGDLVSPLNLSVWRDFPLRARLHEMTGLEVFMAGDVQALALGEQWLGAAQHELNFMALVVSTGIGGGIVLDGRLLVGRTGNAGHVGHVIVQPDGHACSCGGRGCLEAEASGTAIQRIYGLEPEHASADIIEHVGTLVGRAAASVCNLLDLALVVIGGSVALGFGEPFFTSARRELVARARLSFSREARVVPADPAGPLLGAARVGLLGMPR